MISTDLLNCLDRLLRDVTSTNVPFGGKCVVLAGDFRQTLPITRDHSTITSVRKCLKNFEFWPRFVKIHLTQNMRALPGEIEYQNWSLAGGTDQLPKIENNLISIPNEVLCQTNNIVDEVYGVDPIDPATTGELNRAILCPTNEEAHRVNDQVLRKLLGNTFCLFSF